MRTSHPPQTPEARFAAVFGHLDALVAYAARRGSADPEGIAAEAMAIAWRRLSAVPVDNPRPWLFVTARNLLMAERRRAGRDRPLEPADADRLAAPAPETLDAEVTAALRELRPADREVLLLIAWDELSPADAAAALGITPVALRVRLFRARRRLERALAAAGCPSTLELESA